jgi:putative membrane protein
MVSFVVHWAVLAAALWFTSRVVPGVSIDSFTTLAIAAAVLGVVNTVVRPVITLLTLPLTIVTLGAFYLFVNGFAFGFSAALVPGFRVSGVFSAVAGAFVTGFAAWLVGLVVSPRAVPAPRT